MFVDVVNQTVQHFDLTLLCNQITFLVERRQSGTERFPRSPDANSSDFIDSLQVERHQRRLLNI